MAAPKSIKRNMKTAINYLNAAYYTGAIAYPRVDNNYIVPGHSFDLFPHPLLKPSEFIQPFRKKKKINVRKEELILFLSSIRIISPKHIEDVYNYIDFYLDDDLLPYSQAKKLEVELIISTLDAFVKEKKMKDSEIIGLKKELYSSSFAAGQDGFLFSQENVMFMTQGSKNPAKCGYLIRQRSTQEAKKLKHGKIKHAPSVREALDFFAKSEHDLDIAGRQTIINKNN